MTATLAERIACIADGLTYDQIPVPVRIEVRRRLLDTLGCVIAGSDGAPVTRVWHATECMGNSPQATIIGTGARASVARAIFVNCCALRYLDFMDGHSGPYPAHVSFNVIPALAAAEANGASGRDVITSVVLGYEFGIRLQLGIGAPSIEADGWSGSLNLGASTAIVVGKLLGLSVPELTSAIGTATMHSPTLDSAARGQMSDNKVCVDGMIASFAAVATYLAKAGITGPKDVFEGPAGVERAFTGRVDAELLSEPLERFRLLDVYTKRYNGVKCAQTAVAAALQALSSVRGGWQDIEAVEVAFATQDQAHQRRDEAARRRPSTRDTANHSAAFCVAAALRDGDLSPAQFDDMHLNDREILGLVDRIRLTADPAFDQYLPASNPARVVLTTRDGTKCAATVQDFPGHPNNPLRDEDLEKKFRSLCAGKLSGKRTDALIKAIADLEHQESLRPLMELTRPARA